MRIILSLFFVKHVNLVVTAILAHLISLNLMGDPKCSHHLCCSYSVMQPPKKF